jgi:capsular polysaccharide export protein
MEDGFLRSRGLGAAHIEPLSLVLDSLGIYYDATRPSDLEVILETADFTDEELKEARSLRSKIISDGLSKYNVGQDYLLPTAEIRKKVILVPGQVADDASLRFGAGAVASNLDLLKAVRQENPEAFVIYKPHPDVEHGKRAGFLPPNTVLRYADFIGSGLSSHAGISMADEVVTMTSLLGFEALLRGKPVTCHGMPFYAGWGVTDDRMRSERRSRPRTVDEILAAAYLRYARYVDPATRGKINALQAARLLTASLG